MNARARAFTLMELMVAMGVTSVLVVMMLQIFERGSSAWQGNDEKLDTFREARAALQIMARDLSSLSQAPAADAFLSASTSGTTTGTTTTGQVFPILTIDHHRNTPDADKVNDEVYGLIGTRNRGLGDWCAVGYYAQWDATKKAFVLRRQFANSDTTFTKLQGIARRTPAPTTSREVFDLIFDRPALSDGSPLQGESLATYIWDLHIDVPDPNNPNVMMPHPPGFFNRNMPPWIEIRFKALGANAARKLQDKNVTREVWSPSADSGGPTKDLHDHFILPGEQQFYTRVRLTQ